MKLSELSVEGVEAHGGDPVRDAIVTPSRLPRAWERPNGLLGCIRCALNMHRREYKLKITDPAACCSNFVGQRLIHDARRSFWRTSTFVGSALEMGR